ncbi:MAG: DUF5752 family protein [Terriglobia bacterium]
MNGAEHSFVFYTASQLTRIGNQIAKNICELSQALQECSDESIFYHTFQSLGRYHFLTEGFSSDFAQWVLAACNRPELAEKLASLDIRDYVSIGDLRRDLVAEVGGYCKSHAAELQSPAFEPFFFCEALEVTQPLGLEVRTLEEFRDCVARLSHASFHYHFITSRLRLHLKTNDFSAWLGGSLGLEKLAQKVNRIDIYTNTIEHVQQKLLTLINAELTR